MNDNIVKLVFKAALSGGGWSDVSNKLKELLGNSGKLAHGVGALGPAFGTFGMVAGRAIGMLMQGGIWGFAAEGIKLVINKLELFKDKSEEVKRTMAEQKKANDALLESITTGYKHALTKIDDESKKRKELIELTNRQTKAQLELLRSQKIMSGDAAGAKAVEVEMSKQDGRSAVDKADADVAAAEKRVKAARDALAIAQRASRQSDENLAKAEDDLRSKAKPVDMVMQSSAGAYVQTIKRDTTSEQHAVKTSRAESDAAEAKVEAARKALETELQGLQESRKAREIVRLEQEAAEKKFLADKRKAEIDAANAKAKAEKDATKKFFDDAKKHAVEQENARREQAEKNRKEEEQKVREQVRKDVADQSKQRIDLLQKEADCYRKELERAHDEVKRSIDIIGNAGKIDQAKDVMVKRQNKIDEGRFEKESKKLLDGNKLQKDENGLFKAKGRLSNLEQSVLNRMNAEKKQQKAQDAVVSIEREIKNLAKKIEEMTSL